MEEEVQNVLENGTQHFGEQKLPIIFDKRIFIFSAIITLLCLIIIEFNIGFSSFKCFVKTALYMLIVIHFGTCVFNWVSSEKKYEKKSNVEDNNIALGLSCVTDAES